MFRLHLGTEELCKRWFQDRARGLNLHECGWEGRWFPAILALSLSGTVWLVMPAIKELERNIECCRRAIRNLVVMGMNPSQTPDQLELIRNLERSARAELRLRVTALQCELGLGSGSSTG